MTRDDGYTRYTVRIPTPLYERVKKAAGEKSVNAEIVATLEKEYPPLVEADDLTMLGEMTLHILSATDERERERRLDEANARLAVSSVWRGAYLRLVPKVGDGDGPDMSVLVTKRGG